MAREGSFLEHMKQPVKDAVQTYLDQQFPENFPENEFYKCYLSLMPDSEDQTLEENFTIALYEYNSYMPSEFTMGRGGNNLSVCDCFNFQIIVRAKKDISVLLKTTGFQLGNNSDEDSLVSPSLGYSNGDGTYSASRKILNRIYKHLNGKTNFKPKKIDEDGNNSTEDSELFLYTWIYAKQPPFQMGIDLNERNLLVCNFAAYRTRLD